ncbi:MAG: fatty acid desaturase family protein [Pirellulaceae bacterium]
MGHDLFYSPAIRAIAWQDLRGLTSAQVIRGLLLSPPWLLLSLVAAETRLLILALIASAVFFLAGLRQAHDGFHLTLGLPARLTDSFLVFLSLLMAVPLHAIKCCHLCHHARPLGPDDVEGMCAKLPAWMAVLSGPWFTVRMLCYAVHQLGGRQRWWFAVEVVGLFGLVAVAFATEWFWLRYHLVVMMLGNCLTGFFAVWLVHHDCEATSIFARTQRGWLTNWLTLNLFYHLEHHLFPSVPACHLPELARRLDHALPEAREVTVLGIASFRASRAIANGGRDIPRE